MDVNQRLMLVVGIPLVVLLLAAAFVAFQSGEIEDAHQREVEQQDDLASLVEMERSFKAIEGAAHTYAITGDTQNRSQLESRISGFETQMADREDPRDPERRATFTAFKENATRYVELVRRAQGHVEEEDPDDARELLVSPRTSQARANAISNLDALKSAQQRDLDEQQAAVVAAQDTLGRGLLLGLIPVLLVTGVAGYNTVRRLRSTLAGLLDATGNRLDQLKEAREHERDHLLEHLDTVAQARSGVDDLEASTEELGELLDNSAGYPDAIDDAANVGSKRLASSKAGLDETETTMETLTDRVLDVSDEVARMEDLAGEVGELAAEIDMLALNASVEASRTGVDNEVLNEVRDLADRSRAQADRLEGIATNAQAGTQAAARALERGDEALTHTREDLSGVAEAFQQIETGLEEGRAEVRRIRELTEDQQALLEQVSSSLEEAGEDTERISESRQDTSQLITDLEAVLRELREVS